jgi:hypothetical protein
VGVRDRLSMCLYDDTDIHHRFKDDLMMTYMQIHASYK